MPSTSSSRCLSRNLPDSLSLLTLYVAVLPGDYRLETPVAPQYLAFVGSYFLHGSPEFPSHLRLDAKRGRDGIRQGQSKSKPLAVGEPVPYFLIYSNLILDNPQLSEVMSGAAYLHDLGIVHGDLKGVL